MFFGGQSDFGRLTAVGIKGDGDRTGLVVAGCVRISRNGQALVRFHCFEARRSRTCSPLTGSRHRNLLRAAGTLKREGGRGWKQVGYTDLFHLNGGVERLVDNNEDANVDPWEITNGAAGYNSVSRHIVYAGGCAADGKTPKDTRTACQKKALEKYVKDFHRRFPDVRIVGHNELAAKACPSFNVQKWLKEIGINQ